MLRPGVSDPIEVFMMVRHRQIEFASGALVFPGGSVDAGDRDIFGRAELYADSAGPDDATLVFRIAAIRETFEESGILLARPRGFAGLVAATQAAEIAAAHRTALCAGEISFAALLADHALVPALDLLVPLAHWITPEPLPKRFDTWFFLAQAPADQVGMHDGRESTDALWLSPRQALEGAESGRFTLPFPTTRILIKLGKQTGVQAALDDAKSRPIVTVMPVMTSDGDRHQLRIPAAAGYDGELFEVSGRP